MIVCLNLVYRWENFFPPFFWDFFSLVFKSSFLLSIQEIPVLPCYESPSQAVLSCRFVDPYKLKTHILWFRDNLLNIFLAIAFEKYVQTLSIYLLIVFLSCFLSFHFFFFCYWEIEWPDLSIYKLAFPHHLPGSTYTHFSIWSPEVLNDVLLLCGRKKAELPGCLCWA